MALIGVHTPETPWERKSANVTQEIHRLGITYPVLLDPKGVNWNRWGRSPIRGQAPFVCHGREGGEAFRPPLF